MLPKSRCKVLAYEIKILLLFIRPFFAQTPELVHYVNTLQGSNSKHELTRGNIYPTTALLNGMNTWTPQTGRNDDGLKYQ
ncbi:Alpha-1,2-mannosidase [Arcticibacter svalbardensis MN12-7]|uniref:Alpha-1,2-mannosidase n=1 Tax=Arcticibacter svalbardensis MN12-7 TaxID=1150600 RepID=R9GV41_9SPHI|nr:hypothetical protein [Arcticibacter svalbardensis]EOR95692.1 Alpha-1,2-mannosidase [Arcticibacter svalbardensis MN12-7]